MSEEGHACCARNAGNYSDEVVEMKYDLVKNHLNKGRK